MHRQPVRLLLPGCINVLKHLTSVNAPACWHNCRYLLGKCESPMPLPICFKPFSFLEIFPTNKKFRWFDRFQLLARFPSSLDLPFSICSILPRSVLSLFFFFCSCVLSTVLLSLVALSERFCKISDLDKFLRSIFSIYFASRNTIARAMDSSSIVLCLAGDPTERISTELYLFLTSYSISGKERNDTVGVYARYVDTR